jgi:hypothetical protein
MRASIDSFTAMPVLMKPIILTAIQPRQGYPKIPLLQALNRARQAQHDSEYQGLYIKFVNGLDGQ